MSQQRAKMAAERFPKPAQKIQKNHSKELKKIAEKIRKNLLSDAKKIKKLVPPFGSGLEMVCAPLPSVRSFVG